MSSPGLSPSERSVFEAKLRSAESALGFMQKEHRQVLGGLHEEIRRLQQKCSGDENKSELRLKRGAFLLRRQGRDENSDKAKTR